MCLVKGSRVFDVSSKRDVGQLATRSGLSKRWLN